jgi:hypothetical protein
VERGGKGFASIDRAPIEVFGTMVQCSLANLPSMLSHDKSGSSHKRLCGMVLAVLNMEISPCIPVQISITTDEAFRLHLCNLQSPP